MATYLRKNYTLDYRNIYETSKKLRTLTDPIKKLVSQVYNDDADGNSNEDEDDDEELEGNLLEQVKQNMQKIEGNLAEKINTKKRWWTT